MVVEKKLTQGQKDANWLAFAEFLENKKHASRIKLKNNWEEGYIDLSKMEVFDSNKNHR